jgi:lysyl-tRNA synthetase class 2
MMDLVEKLMCHVVRSVKGGLTLQFDEETVDFTPPWRRLSLIDAISEACGRDVSALSAEELKGICVERGLEVKEPAVRAKLLEELFDGLVKVDLVQPTFVLDYPKELSPLAKAKRGNPKLVERFEPYAGRMELGNAFSEQNDPAEQADAFRAQSELRRMGDLEAQVMDTDYVEALEHGMPPAGGVGLGIDRIAMLVTGSSNIREVILFPHMRVAPPGEESD